MELGILKATQVGVSSLRRVMQATSRLLAKARFCCPVHAQKSPYYALFRRASGTWRVAVTHHHHACRAEMGTMRSWMAGSFPLRWVGVLGGHKAKEAVSPRGA